MGTTADVLEGTTTLPPPVLTTPQILIRPYHPTDAPSTAHHANSPAIASRMTNLFPHPYTPSDAERWITAQSSAQPPTHFAIALNAPADPRHNTVVGGIGLKLNNPTDVHVRTAEIGYWLGEEWWGRGVMTEAVRAFTVWAFRVVRVGGGLELERIWAGVFKGNEASGRVLDKAGYVCEGTQRRAVWKWGRVLDLRIYAVVREDWQGGGRV